MRFPCMSSTSNVRQWKQSSKYSNSVLDTIKISRNWSSIPPTIEFVCVKKNNTLRRVYKSQLLKPKSETIRSCPHHRKTEILRGCFEWHFGNWCTPPDFLQYCLLVSQYWTKNISVHIHTILWEYLTLANTVYSIPGLTRPFYFWPQHSQGWGLSETFNTFLPYLPSPWVSPKKLTLHNYEIFDLCHRFPPNTWNSSYLATT